MTDGDVSLEGKYIRTARRWSNVDYPDIEVPVASGASVTLAGLGTFECVSDEGCSGTVEDGDLTITGDLKIVSVDPDLDSATAMLLAKAGCGYAAR